MNVSNDQLLIGHNEEKSVSTELENVNSEINVTKQACVEIPSINPATMPDTLQAMFNSMLASLKSNQEEMIATLQDSFKSEISALQIKVKEDIRLENQKLIKKFEKDHQSLRHELTEKLSSETDKFSHMLRQAQDDTESELVAVKKNFQVMSTEFDVKLGQQTKDTSRIVDELTDKIVQNKEQVTDQIAKLSEEISTVKSNFANDEEVFQKGKGSVWNNSCKR
jgi:hypothetical protein